MILKELTKVDYVIDTRENLLEVAEAELLLFKFNYNIDVFFGQRSVTVGVLIQLLNYFLQVRVLNQVQGFFTLRLPIQTQ